jgi:hypothetical protein
MNAQVMRCILVETYDKAHCGFLHGEFIVFFSNGFLERPNVISKDENIIIRGYLKKKYEYKYIQFARELDTSLPCTFRSALSRFFQCEDVEIPQYLLEFFTTPERLLEELLSVVHSKHLLWTIPSSLLQDAQVALGKKLPCMISAKDITKEEAEIAIIALNEDNTVASKRSLMEILSIRAYDGYAGDS